MIQIIPYMGLNFAIYDWLTTTTDTTDNSTASKTHTSVSAAYAGSVSGALSKSCVYPIDTVKRRLQAQAFFVTASSHEQYYYEGMWDCIRTIYQQEGITSFYRGMVPSVLKTAIATSLTFAFFRWTKNSLEGFHDYHHNQVDGTSSKSGNSKVIPR